jgi:hypothetical protein
MAVRAGLHIFRRGIAEGWSRRGCDKIALFPAIHKADLNKVLAAFRVSSDRSQGLGGPLLGSSRPRELVAFGGGRC